MKRSTSRGQKVWDVRKACTVQTVTCKEELQGPQKLRDGLGKEMRCGRLSLPFPYKILQPVKMCMLFSIPSLTCIDTHTRTPPHLQLLSKPLCATSDTHHNWDWQTIAAPQILPTDRKGSQRKSREKTQLRGNTATVVLRPAFAQA